MRGCSGLEREEVYVEMRAELVRLVPVLVRVLPILLVLIALAAGIAESGGYQGPPDFDPY